MLEPGAAGAAQVTLRLRPNRTLTPAGLRTLSASLAAIAIAVAWLSATQGNVFAPLFALVEAAAIVITLRLAWRAGDRGERITLDADSLEVEAFPGSRRASFQSYWVRVRLKPGSGRQRLLLSAHGRVLEIGAFLAEQERAELSQKLRALLAEKTGREHPR